MPIQTTWALPDQTTVLQVFEDKWTIADLHMGFDTVGQMRVEANQPLNVIIKFDPSASMIPGNVFSATSRLERLFKNDVKMTVMVNASRYLKAIVKVATKMAPNAVSLTYFADSLDEALVIVQQQSSVAA